MKITSWSVVVLAALASGVARAQESFELVSATPGGHFGNDDAVEPSVSGNGRFVAFTSWASNLVTGDTNGALDVFVRDLDLDVTERVNLTSSGGQTQWGSGGGGWFGAHAPPAISHDGSIVAFMTSDPAVVPGDTNGAADVFVRDRVAGTTTRVSFRPGGGEFAGHCGAAQISADGTRVLFAHLPPPGTWGTHEWYVHDRTNGVTQLVSVVPDAGAIRTDAIRLAAGGRHVLFMAHRTAAPNFYGNFVRDIDAGLTKPATSRSGWNSSSGPLIDDVDEFTPMAISASGRYVLCESFEDFDPTDGFDTEWYQNAWVLDRVTETFRLVTRYVIEPGSPWLPEFYAFRGYAHISDDGLVARLRVSGSGLIGFGYDDKDLFYEIDLTTTETRVLSLNWRMRPFEGWTNYQDFPFSTSDDGQTVAVQIVEESYLSPFRLWGNSDAEQIYVRRVRGSAGVTYCAGDGTGASCPCGTPGIAGRGCANAFTARGAEISTRGNASLTDDSLTLVAYETTFGPSFLLQSSSAAPSGGVPFEGGVLCVGSPALRIAIDDTYHDDLGVVKMFGRGAFSGLFVHELGAISTPGTRYYQVWTRAQGGPTCFASRSSLTNGVRVEWRP